MGGSEKENEIKSEKYIYRAKTVGAKRNSD
jgi:hypothetical protein